MNYYDDADVQLMLDFKAGNVRSFEQLMKNYFPRVLNFISRHLGNRNVAEDLTQEVFIRVYKNASTYRPKAQFKTWLYTIARNLTHNELRKRNPRTISLSTVVDEDEGRMEMQVEDKRALPSDGQLMRAETIASVKKAIYALPEKQRTAIILRRYENFSYHEIARTMKMSEKGVKSLIWRGREALRKALTEVIRDY